MKQPETQVRSLPHKTGVYLFRNDRGTVIYVGKASDLRNRVRSYFSSHPDTPKIRKMIPMISDIDFFLTESEQEALILESNLIKKYQPPFNVRLKDDKSYPYIKITAEAWPRVTITRHLKEDGSRYFGPYANAGSIRRTLNWINKVFPYRTCRKTITGNESRPCLKYHINRCAGPCIGAVSPQEYTEIIGRVALFLKGKQDQVLRQLKQKMAQSAKKLEFEKAAALRDQIQALERLVGEQRVISSSRVNEDAIAFAQEKNHACAQVFFVREGKLVGKEHFVLEGTQDEQPGRIITTFIEQFYNKRPEIPPRILLQFEPEDKELIRGWLRTRRGKQVHLIAPQRGEKRQLLAMAAENAAERLQQLHIKWLTDSGKTGAALEELKKQLNLPRMPKRIECYDISNIQGKAAVGSMVVFEDGQPRNSLYRRFKIKSVSGIDDYAMMAEVLRRRFGRAHLHSDSDRQNDWEMPDLILIDGGRGHLNAILQLTRKLEIPSLPLASIAKENEEVYIPDVPDPIILPRNSQGLYLLQRIRDEAHRFAISYHTKVRRKSAFTSRLDQIPGIGPNRKRNLLKRFGSIKGIAAASIDELAAVPGMTRSLAERLKDTV